MKIFLTGATGYIGAAVAKELKDAGHEVAGLTHSPAKKAALEAAGIRPVVGDLKQPDSFRKEAEAAEALIHAAFEYSPEGPQADRAAIDALLAAARAAKAPRIVLYTSGVWVLGPRKDAAASEETPAAPIAAVAWRPGHEEAVLDASGGDLACVVLRPGCVYGGRGGLYGRMIQSAQEKHVVSLVGDGKNHWAGVHLEDLAVLYRLLVEKRPERGIFHGTDDSYETLEEQAKALLAASGKGNVEHQPLEQARKQMGPFADALAIDQRVASDRTRRTVGWKPKHRGVAAEAKKLVQEWKG